MSNIESTHEAEEERQSPVAAHCTDIVSVRKGEEEADEPEDTLSMFDDVATEAEDSQYVSKLEGLGPIILNTDGTMGRIPNWSEYTASEKEQAIRLISARNKKRKEALLLARQASATK